MPNLLHVVKSMRMFTGELHPTCLYVYDSYMVYVKRGIIRRSEATISYNHVSQVYLKRGIIGATLEIINTGGVENIEVKWLPIGQAEKAKRLIDEKVFHTHARISGKQQDLIKEVPDIERRMARLKELKLKGIINDREFEKQKKEMLKSV